MKNLRKYIILCCALAVGACDREREPSTADNTKDREIILTHWVDNIIVPSYEDFADAFAVMAEKSDAFTSAPDITTLVGLREAWGDAYFAWQTVELFEFGPAFDHTLRNFFNIYPADVSGIISNINDPAVDLDRFTTYATQGFPALDYLLNGIAVDDAAIVAAYTTDGDAAKRIAYLERIVSRMETMLSTVLNDWTGPYRDTFISKTGLDIGSSFGLVVNAYVLYYERFVRSGKIGIPSGAAIGTTGGPFPERIEAYYKRDISRDLATTAHEAARDFFNGKNVGTGTDGPSFKSYLDALGSKDATTGGLLSDIISGQFDIIRDELNDLSPDLHAQIQTDNTQMEETYTSMQRLVRLLKVDMTSAMSVTITYTDNDGD